MTANVNAKLLKRPNPLRMALVMMVNPGAVLKKAVAGVPWPFSLCISGLAFTLLFLQTGLDLLRTGQRGVGFVVLLCLAGLFFGTLGIAMLAVAAWVITKIFKGDKPLKWVVSAFGLGYCSTLIFSLLGLLFSLIFQWNTSVAFGVTGLLWATGPLIASVREMSRENTALAVIVATVCSALLLLGWAILGNA